MSLSNGHTPTQAAPPPATATPQPIAGLGQYVADLGASFDATTAHVNDLTAFVVAKQRAAEAAFAGLMGALANGRSGLAGMAILAASEVDRLNRDLGEATAESAAGLASDDAVELTTHGVAVRVGYAEYDGQGDLRVEATPRPPVLAALEAMDAVGSELVVRDAAAEDAEARHADTAGMAAQACDAFGLSDAERDAAAYAALGDKEDARLMEAARAEQLDRMHLCHGRWESFILAEGLEPIPPTSAYVEAEFGRRWNAVLGMMDRGETVVWGGRAAGPERSPGTENDIAETCAAGAAERMAAMGHDAAKADNDDIANAEAAVAPPKAAKKDKKKRKK